MANDQSTNDDRRRRIDDCRNLCLKYDGKQHELIEQEMRALGHTDFHRRILHDRFERGRHRAGWIGRYGFNSLVREKRAKDRFTADSLDTGKMKRRVRCVRNVEGALKRGHCEISSDISPLRPGVSPVQMPDFPEFQTWLKTVSPTMEWGLETSGLYLQTAASGVLRHSTGVLFLPPRHGKSGLVTVRFTAWCLKQDPSLNAIIGCYNQRLANRFSRKIRRVLTDDHALTAGPQKCGGTMKRKKDPGGGQTGQSRLVKDRHALKVLLSVRTTLPLITRRPSRSRLIAGKEFRGRVGDCQRRWAACGRCRRRCDGVCRADRHRRSGKIAC